MKPYTSTDYHNALNTVHCLVQTHIADSPEATNRPSEEAAAVLGPLTSAVQIASLITPELRTALALQQMKKGTPMPRPTGDSDRDALATFLDTLTTILIGR